MLRTKTELDALIGRDPFHETDPTTHHRSVTFLKQPPLATPPGGASTIIDKPWGTPTTTRWWNVVVDVADKFDAR